MKLHHCAFKATLGSSRLLQEFCEFMGAKLVWEGHDKGREIAMQFDSGFRLQISEKDETPSTSKYKQESHIAFVSENPKKDMESVNSWFSKQGIATRQGKWSDRELWLDCPDIFVDFVIEVFKPKDSHNA